MSIIVDQLFCLINLQWGGGGALRSTDVSSEVSTVFTEIMEDGILEKSDEADHSVGEKEQKLCKCYPRKLRYERKDLERISKRHGTKRLVTRGDQDGRSR